MKYAILGFAMFASTSAMAQDTVVATPAVANVVIVQQSAKTTFDAVCASNFVLSPAATEACAAGTMPKINKDGINFRNSGIGAEIMTLARQL